MQEATNPNNDDPFRTPVKARRPVVLPEDEDFQNDNDQRYIITSLPSPRVSHINSLQTQLCLFFGQISGLKNTVSKYHPSRRVSLRSTPFKQRIEDEVSREENLLSEIRKKPSFHS